MIILKKSSAKKSSAKVYFAFVFICSRFSNILFGL